MGMFLETDKILDEIKFERIKQIQLWGNESDDAQVNNEIARGAAAYCLNDPSIWPTDNTIWHSDGFKREEHVGRRSQLIRAATMIVAEIERLDRRK